MFCCVLFGALNNVLGFKVESLVNEGLTFKGDLIIVPYTTLKGDPIIVITLYYPSKGFPVLSFYPTHRPRSSSFLWFIFRIL